MQEEKVLPGKIKMDMEKDATLDIQKEPTDVFIIKRDI